METIKALTFDTGGTILDWHTGIGSALAAAGGRHGLERDWPAITNDYRTNSLKAMVNAGTDAPATFNIDDVHREQLGEMIAKYDLGAFTAEDRQAIWYTWHQLDCWPDFPAALTKLREKFVVASFTILTVSLIVDTAKRNGLSWDAVISCEMIGTYKTRPKAYQQAAKWLALEPSEILMVACHNFDLNAARDVGFKSAFVRRPDEWGVTGPPDPKPDDHHDIIADDFPDLARQLGI
ncbi:MAG: haloacid dehalogenase type II [Rhodospirillaceae bacterium]|jgi:2-haloacid dehalogenase|nr:haloacid dehalogenase type II [Rhodospirillaceae bacterium]MBT4488924.1 haloacid dehalogenase type II [Rhodospirillaceae bacterium]MBT5193648.1 haloacid dehalogenase type II [Rhodospirillaceae bacterium]MBT5894252.1 haloacid dehalogenase type II [Rhodospirillaceae bacterium]MBT6428939.1 haloacid dehalogenase type II [Rhodospirillaceae bacterium]